MHLARLRPEAQPHPEAHRILATHYKPGDLNEARLRMAHTPEGATLITNPVSRAPGFQIGNVFVMAGVPVVMQAMLDGVLPRLKGGKPVLSRAIVCNLAEGTIAKGLGALQDRYPDLDIGPTLVPPHGYGVSLVLRGTDAGASRRRRDELKSLIRELGDEPQEDTGAS